MTAKITVSEATADAVDFAREAWRDCWAAMILVGAGSAAVFVSQHAQLADGQAGRLGALGMLLALFNLPLIGGLFRSSLGGAARKGLGFGGVQFGAVEIRIVLITILLALVLFIAAIPVAMVGGVLYLVGGGLGLLAGFKPWAIGTVVFGVFCTGVLVYVLGRLSLVYAATTAERRVVTLDAWPMTAGHVTVILLTLLLVQAPTALGWLAMQCMAWFNSDEITIGLNALWPAPQAIAAGVGLGLLGAVIQAPLTVGVLSVFFDVLSGRAFGTADDGAVRRDHGHAGPELAFAASPAAVAPPLALVGPFDETVDPVPPATPVAVEERPGAAPETVVVASPAEGEALGVEPAAEAAVPHEPVMEPVVHASMLAPLAAFLSTLDHHAAAAPVAHEGGVADLAGVEAASVHAASHDGMLTPLAGFLSDLHTHISTLASQVAEAPVEADPVPKVQAIQVAGSVTHAPLADPVHVPDLAPTMHERSEAS